MTADATIVKKSWHLDQPFSETQTFVPQEIYALRGLIHVSKWKTVGNMGQAFKTWHNPQLLTLHEIRPIWYYDCMDIPKKPFKHWNGGRISEPGKGNVEHDDGTP